MDQRWTADGHSWPTQHMDGRSAVPKTAARRPLLDREHYDSMIRVCGHKGDVERAEAVLQMMQADGHAATVETYNLVLNACTQHGDIERAKMHVEHMLRMGLEPNMVTFNLLLNGAAAEGDLQGVEEHYRSMVHKGIKPNSVTFGTICKAFARNGDVEKVETVMQAMDAAGEHMNEYFFAALISACGSARPPRLARAEKAFKELVQRGIRPASVKSALVKALGKKKAISLLRAHRRRSAISPIAGNAALTLAPPPGLEDVLPLRAPPSGEHAWPDAEPVPSIPFPHRLVDCKVVTTRESPVAARRSRGPEAMALEWADPGNHSRASAADAAGLAAQPPSHPVRAKILDGGDSHDMGYADYAPGATLWTIWLKDMV